MKATDYCDFNDGLHYQQYDCPFHMCAICPPHPADVPSQYPESRGLTYDFIYQKEETAP